MGERYSWATLSPYDCYESTMKEVPAEAKTGAALLSTSTRDQLLMVRST